MQSYHPFAHETVSKARNCATWDGLKAARAVLLTAINAAAMEGGNESAGFVLRWMEELVIDGFLVLPPDETCGCRIEASEALLRRFFAAAKAKSPAMATRFMAEAGRCGLADRAALSGMAQAIAEMGAAPTLEVAAA